MQADPPDPETMARLITALGGDEDSIRKTIRAGAAAFGVSERIAAERFLAGVLSQRHDALEVLSDDDLPAGAIELGKQIATDTGQRITAIKRAEGGHAYHTTGNPILIETWARAHGRAAIATGPSTCIIYEDAK